MNRARANTRAAAAIVALATVLTGCGLLPVGGDEVNVKTPKQAREELIKELTAVANETIPGGHASMRVDIPDHGCGTGGTGHDRIYSDISGSIGNPDLADGPDKVMATARQSLTKRGWSIRAVEGRNNPTLAFQDDQGAGGRLTYDPEAKWLAISAVTECLSNPDD